MQKILIIRFGSLGDLCVLAWTLQRLAAVPGREGREVTLVTKAAFAPLMAKAGGVDRVVSLKGSGLGDLNRLAESLRGESWDTVIDAHGVLRSRLLTTIMGRSVRARLAKDTLARLALLKLRRDSDRLHLTMHDRFAGLLAGLPGLAGSPGKGAPSDHNGLPAATEAPLAAWLADKNITAGDAGCLGLSPGARWDTKRWPADRFAGLLARHRAADPRPVRIFLGPRESVWYPDSPLDRVAASLPDVEVTTGMELPEVARRIAGCSLLLTNDSGLLHVAEASGVPVLALFGPTVRQFGYFPCLPGSRVLERNLDCRPCSRNGKRACHRGDLACLAEIDIAEVLTLTGEMLAGASATARKGTP